MNAHIDKIKLLEMMRVEHEFLRRTIAPLSTAQLIQPGVMGEWSIKDIVSHIVIWEQRFLRWVEDAARGESLEQPEPGYAWEDVDRLNADDHRANRDRPLLDVLAEFERSHLQAYGILAGLPDEILFTPGYYPFTRGKALWEYAASSTYEHIAEHTAIIREWRSRQP